MTNKTYNVNTAYKIKADQGGVFHVYNGSVWNGEEYIVEEEVGDEAVWENFTPTTNLSQIFISNNLLYLFFDDVIVDYKLKLASKMTNIRRSLRGVLNPIPIFSANINLTSLITGMNFVQKNGQISGNMTIHTEASPANGKVFLDFEYDFGFDIIPRYGDNFNFKFSKLRLTRSQVILDEYELYTGSSFEQLAVKLINDNFEDSSVLKDPLVLFDTTEAVTILPTQGIVFTGHNN